MNREGAGFLGDLAVLWGTLTVCLIVANILVEAFGRPWGLVAAVAVSLVIVFVVLVAYYRVFLDEQPLLGTAEQSRFAVLVFQIVIVGFVIGALFGPRDPTAQTVLAGLIIVGGVAVAFWVVYRRGATPATS